MLLLDTSKRTADLDSSPLTDDTFTDEMIEERAWQLAASVLASEKNILESVEHALDLFDAPFQVEQEIRAQKNSRKRWYKVKRDRALLVDKYTYLKTTRLERQEEEEWLEGRRQLDEDYLVARYVKKVRELSLDHNCLHIAVNHYRVLFNFDAAQVRKIYQHVEGCGPELPRADVMRRLRGKTVRKLHKRFNPFLDGLPERDKHCPTELHLLPARATSSSLYRHVAELLDVHTPSLPVCPFHTERLGSTAAEGGSPGTTSTPIRKDEHYFERENMHTMAHLSCFLNVKKRLGLAPPSPEEALEIPLFRLPHNGNGAAPPPVYKQTGKMSPEQREVLAMKKEQRRKQRYKSPAVNFVKVYVDDEERGVLRLNAPAGARVELEEGDSTIEFRTPEEGGSLTLGVFDVKWDDRRDVSRPDIYRMKMWGDKTIHFAIAFTRDEYGDLCGAMADFAYMADETLAQLWLRRVRETTRALAARLRTAPALALRNRAFTGAVGVAAVGAALLCLFWYGRFGAPPSGGSAAAVAVLPDPHATQETLAIQDTQQPRAAEVVNANLVSPPAKREDEGQPKKQNKLLPGKISGADAKVPSAGQQEIATLAMGVKKSFTKQETPGSLRPGIAVLTFATHEKSFARLSEIDAGDGTLVSLPELNRARSVFLRGSGTDTPEQKALAEAFRVNNYIVSNDPATADAFVEGRVMREKSTVTLNVLVNSTDGNVVWFKTVSSGSKSLADMSGAILRSFRAEPRPDLYVDINFYNTLARAGARNAAPARIVPDGSDPTLLESLGGVDGITRLINDFVSRAAADSKLKGTSHGLNSPELGGFLVRTVCAATGGTEPTSARHPDVNLTNEEFNRLMQKAEVALDQAGLQDQQQREMLGILQPLRTQLVRDDEQTVEALK
jgi:hemoglobin